MYYIFTRYVLSEPLQNFHIQRLRQQSLHVGHVPTSYQPDFRHFRPLGRLRTFLLNSWIKLLKLDNLISFLPCGKSD